MLELAVGAVLAATTYGAGILTGRRQRRYRAPAEICQCKHGSAFHDAAGCHTMVSGQILKYSEYEIPIKWEQVECPCVRYVGPLTSYVPELDSLNKEITP